MFFEDLSEDDQETFGEWYRAGLLSMKFDENGVTLTPSEKLLGYLKDGTMKAIYLTEK